jgi:Bacterial antitoxin of type II TA system, VapB
MRELLSKKEFKQPSLSLTTSAPLYQSPKLSCFCNLPHKEFDMATHLALDPILLDRVVAVSGEPTKKAAVTLALREFLARREQKRIAELFDKLEWDAGYDHKTERSRG